MNQYPLWKNLLALFVVLLGAFYAWPNIYPNDLAIEVTLRSGEAATASTVTTLERTLAAEDVDPDAIYLDEGRVISRFSTVEDQLKAIVPIRSALDEDRYVAALTLVPRVPGWMRKIGLEPMSLGLDLRGGVYFLYQVDMDAALNQALENFARDYRGLLQRNDIRYFTVRQVGDSIQIPLRDGTQIAEARRLIQRDNQGLEFSEGVDDRGNAMLTIRMSEPEIRQRKDFAIQQNIATLRERLNELGLAEPLVQRQGESRIVVQMPGAQDPSQIERVLGATATLEFHAVDDDGDAFAARDRGKAPPGRMLFEYEGFPILLNREVIVSGDQLTDATQGFDQQSGSPAVFVRLDSQGARRMLQHTKAHVGDRMAVLFVEEKADLIERDGEIDFVRHTERRVINAATVQGVFSRSFQITGMTTVEARDLSLLLRAGSLAAPIFKVEERTVGPSLGQDNIDQGRQAILVGFALVVIFMFIYYKWFGLVANLALFTNLVMIAGVLSFFQASLTLPGIAGIVLTVGMAVDANVLIFERIREELRNGNTPQASIHAGYEKAFSTIADANITTFIAAIVLFTFGTGPIKGFAITLSIGIATSMFTSIVGTRAVVNLLFGNRRLETVPV